MTAIHHVASTAGPPPALPSRRRWAVLGVVCLSLMVLPLDTTILNVALPTLARRFHADNSGLQWIVDAYTLVLAGLLLTAGSLGDRVGRRRCLTIGLVVFGASSHRPWPAPRPS